MPLAVLRPRARHLAEGAEAYLGSDLGMTQSLIDSGFQGESRCLLSLIRRSQRCSNTKTIRVNDSIHWSTRLYSRRPN
jgi:hypothetical protein